MTLDQLQQRVTALEVELRDVKGHLATLSGQRSIPGFGPVGAFADDPDFDDFCRTVREERERVNRESLVEFDREAERQAEAKKKRRKKPAKPARR